MSKGKSLGLTILCGVFSVIFLFTPLLYGCVFPFLIVGLVFGLIAYKKYQRDTNIISEAYQPPTTADSYHEQERVLCDLASTDWL